MIKVYHYADELGCDMPRDPDALRRYVRANESRYRHVANVQTDDAEEAERLTTNNPSYDDHFWWESEQVEFFGSAAYGMEGSRDTARGDFLEFEDGHRVIVAVGGFIKFTF